MDRDSHALAFTRVQGVGDEPGRERQERHHEQDEQVEAQKNQT
ncbi:hypothetical protein ACFQ9Z_33805 [Streptomyces sp. NPDC056580]